MMFFIILVLVIAVGALLFFVFVNKQGDSTDSSTGVEAPLDIRNVGIGGTLILKGVGPNLEDVDLVVDSKHTYREDGFEWFELECLNGAEKVWIEVEEDDELCVSMTLKKLKLSDLGISKSDLKKWDDKEDGSFAYEGFTYHYEDSGKAKFFRHGKGGGESFYYWDFESEDEQSLIGVEKWGSGEYEGFLSEPLRPSQVKVFTNN